MSTIQQVAIEMDKFSLKEENTFSKENNCKNYLQLKESKTRSTPTSPNCYRTQNLQNAKPKARESPVIRLALFPRLEKCMSEPEVWDKGTGDEDEDKTCPGSKSEGHLSDMSGAEEAEGDPDTQVEKADDADDIEDATKKRSMLSESHNTSAPSVIGLRHGHEVSPPSSHGGEALIMPRKVQNPCLDSRDHQNLHRELIFNQKVGKNVLNQKSELQRALEKHKELQMKKELELQKQDNRTPLEKVIEERARRLESLEKSNNIEEEPSDKPEFLQVHAKLRARMDSK